MGNYKFSVAVFASFLVLFFSSCATVLPNEVGVRRTFWDTIKGKHLAW